MFIFNVVIYDQMITLIWLWFILTLSFIQIRMPKSRRLDFYSWEGWILIICSAFTSFRFFLFLWRAHGMCLKMLNNIFKDYIEIGFPSMLSIGILISNSWQTKEEILLRWFINMKILVMISISCHNFSTYFHPPLSACTWRFWYVNVKLAFGLFTYESMKIIFNNNGNSL